MKTSLKEGEKIYVQYCTPCHGFNGDGKGFNAKNLDPRPANHTDGGFMKKRMDKELYDAVSGGGKAVGKSTLMPPWGNTFNETQIKSLISYLRKLCGCEGE
ncbi:MAG: cytochrome c [Nitrospirae bacterium]|nr:cytochrome c [Nitrospirota bacterium]